MFVMVTGDDGFKYAINVDRILWVSPDSRSVCMSATNGQWDVLMSIRREDIQRLLDMAGVDVHGER